MREATVSRSVLLSFPKRKDTRYGALRDLISRRQYNPKNIRRVVVWAMSCTLWHDSNGNRNVPYLNWNGDKWCLSWIWLDDDNWNSNDRLVRPRCYLSSPAYTAGVSLSIFRCQPPIILPISLSGSEIRMYFLLSSTFVSQAMRRRNFTISSFCDADKRYDNFFVFAAPAAENTYSITSRKVVSILSPSV